MSPVFNLLPLHDATLVSMKIDWANKVCTVGCATHTGPKRLQFGGVQSIRVPMEDPWGPSVSIMRLVQEGDVFRIEMQSGDNIEVVATNFTYD
jgi:hypothetical protein